MEYKDIMITIAKVQEMLHKGFVDYADGLLDELLYDLQSAQQSMHLTGGTHPLVEFLSDPDSFLPEEQNPVPPTRK